jgi:hypothetical protein
MTTQEINGGVGISRKNGVKTVGKPPVEALETHGKN